MKKKNKSVSSPTKRTSGVGLGVWVGIAVLLVAVCAILYFPKETKISKSNSENSMSSPSKVQSPSEPVAPQERKTSSEILSYEEYMIMSKKNGWLPVDPVEKLEATIVKFGQLMDVVDPKDIQLFSQYLAMLNTEVSRMISILSHSTHRIINLTNAVYRALDVIHEVTYRIMKLALSTGNARMITRSSVNGNLQHWMYGPLRELLKVISNYPQHITAAINASTGQVSVLERIVTHKWYGLISVAMDIGADAPSIIQALRISIIQSDDMAVAGILHHLSRTKHSITIEVLAALPSLQELAGKLQLPHIQERLKATMTRDSPSVALFNEYLPYAHYPVQCLVSPHSIAAKIDVAGYVEPTIAYVYKESGPASWSDTAVESTISMQEEDPATDPDSLSVCQVERKDVSALSMEDFYSQYVALNRPVVLYSTSTTSRPHVITDSSSSSTKASQPVHDRIWELNTLLTEMGDTMEVASAIPYATLFGHTEEILSLEDFVRHPEKGMRAYSDRFAAALESLCTTQSPGTSVLHSAVPERNRRMCSIEGSEKGLAGQQALSEAQVALLRRMLGLPRYIFSGVQQNMNKAMRKYMLQAVLAFDQNNSTTSKSGKRPTGKLLDYMYAVSTPPQQQPAGTHHRDFKSHWKSQFYLGPVLSGAPFHHHGPAFNLLVHGRKQWTLLPPGRDIYSSVHPIDWISEGGVNASYYPYKDDNYKMHSSITAKTPTGSTDTSTPAAVVYTDQPCQLIQQAGEVLYVPRHWTHQILNLAESVGFAVEIDDYKV